ncbi:MAG: NAD/NADP octopine/nopaline dehydrogenase family protein, partial [Bacteroidaceae bacterium]|nr:NAD/NADP octopine/nopaline dehydrogenase family protein [Bacteroidaceae bacterium]
EYGHLAELKGYKDSLSVAALPPEGKTEESSIFGILESLFHVPVRRLGSIYEASLSNSNPLLHTSRLYTMWHDWRPGVYYPANPMFYSDWTVEASRLYIAMDDELQLLVHALGLPPGSIPPVLDYYESTDASSLTAKLRSIEGFRGISSPMRHTSAGWEPDFQSRYFREDFPYGLRYPWQLAKEHQISTPNIDKVYQWGSSYCQ